MQENTKKEITPYLDTFHAVHSEKAPSNETPTLTKSTIMVIWVVGTTNQLCIRGS